MFHITFFVRFFLMRFSLCSKQTSERGKNLVFDNIDEKTFRYSTGRTKPQTEKNTFILANVVDCGWKKGQLPWI